MSEVTFLAPLAAAFLIVANLVAAAVAALAPAEPFRRLTSRGVRRVATTSLAGLALLPLATAGLVTVALASPDPYVGCHCLMHGLHHPHLCADHTELGRALVGPAFVVIMLWLAAAGRGLSRLAREAAFVERWTRGVRRQPTEVIDGVAFRLHDAGGPDAFTGGLLHPVISVDRGLWGKLTDEERRAVIHHEHAHVARRDGLTLWLLRFAGAIFPLSDGTRFVSSWREAAEALCDRYAASKTGAEAVASALVAVARAHGQTPGPCGTVPLLAFGGPRPTDPMPGSGPPLERRVLLVLDADPTATIPLAGDARPIALGSFAAAVLVAAWPGDAVHHLLETALGLTLH